MTMLKKAVLSAFASLALVLTVFACSDGGSSTSGAGGDTGGVSSSSVVGWQRSSSSNNNTGGVSSSSVIGGRSSSSSGDRSSSSLVMSSSSSLRSSSSESYPPEGEFIDDRDGRVYEYVTIGKQVWMVWDLGYEPTSGGYFNGYYDWATAMALPSSCNSSSCSSQVQFKHQGICPDGWHIPSDAEWTTLTNYVGANAGTKLKSADYWDGTDDYGFSAGPGGAYFSGSAGGVGSNGNWWPDSYDYDYNPYGLWWSATESHSGFAYNRRMDSGNSDVDRDISNNYGIYIYNKTYGYSVRCVRD